MRVIIITPTGISETGPDGALPLRFKLLGNHPNPFNPSTDISFTAPRPARVRLEIFNMLGQKTKTLYEGVVKAGINTVRWDGRTDSGKPAASGIYYCRLMAGGDISIESMTLIK